jgi:hypothetical protein
MEDHRLKESLERRLGAEEGEAFDRRLRDDERVERDERLSRISWGADRIDSDDDAAPLLGGQPTLSELQMEREIKRLMSYYNAVENSRVWRLTQRLRRLAGRAW